MNVLFDMETADPDDFLTLCFLATHPKVNLVGVTITPGTVEQLALVAFALHKLGRPIPIGSNHLTKIGCVSSFHYKLFPQEEIFNYFYENNDWLNWTAPRLMMELSKQYSDLILLTGGPLKNLHAALKDTSFQISQWIAQGGFAGDSLVAPEHRLEKFAGRETCPTFNFNGDPKGALLALGTDQIKERLLVSKNVCHGTLYDVDFHSRYTLVKDKTVGSKLIHYAMNIYLGIHPKGKMLHDPLAACAMLNRNVCEFTEVEVYRSRGEWGSRKASGTKTSISVSVDKQKFEDTFMLKDC